MCLRPRASVLAFRGDDPSWTHVALRALDLTSRSLVSAAAVSGLEVRRAHALGRALTGLPSPAADALRREEEAFEEHRSAELAFRGRLAKAGRAPTPASEEKALLEHRLELLAGPAQPAWSPLDLGDAEGALDRVVRALMARLPSHLRWAFGLSQSTWLAYRGAVAHRGMLCDLGGATDQPSSAFELAAAALRLTTERTAALEALLAALPFDA